MLVSEWGEGKAGFSAHAEQEGLYFLWPAGGSTQMNHQFEEASYSKQQLNIHCVISGTSVMS